MNNDYNKISEKILEKLTEILEEQLDVDPEKVTLDANFITDLDADDDDFGILHLIMLIEEEFDVEISDEEAERLCTVGEVLNFLLNKEEIIIKIEEEEQEEQERQRIEEERQKEIKILKTQIFKFLNTKDINEEIFLKLLENDEIKSNWEKISDFVKIVDQKSFTISEIAKYSFIFQNDFILSNVENIYKIVVFLENNNITVNEIISFINDGEIERIKNDIEAIKKSMEEKQDLIREKKVEINTKKSEIQSLEKIIQNLDKEVGNLNEEIRVLQTELNEFL